MKISEINKIVIFGFPHCGTTILRNILGHCEQIKELLNEPAFVKQASESHKYTLCKTPFPINLCEYEDYVKIMILRNPVYVFSSLNKRFKNKDEPNHTLDDYISALKLFDSIKHGKNNTYKLIYSDMFKNNYLQIRNILADIDIQYDDRIFNNSLWENKFWWNIKYSDIKEKPTYRNAVTDKDNLWNYRTYQINQEFKNFNKKNAVSLTPSQVKIIKNSKIINKYFDTSTI